MKILYFDCFAGASGDMLLAALLDAGASEEFVREELAKLPLTDYELQLTRVVKKGISALNVTVDVAEDKQPHRHFKDIAAMLQNCGLTPEVMEMSLGIFRRLAEAEGKVHGKEPEAVHFHEVGAVDSIVDIVGIAAALFSLGADRLYSSALHTGSGFVRCAHGELPVPAPATLELLNGFPAYSRGIETELLTPTGAAVLTTVAEFSHLPAMTVTGNGYGAGKKDLPMANLLRVIVGETKEKSAYVTEKAVVLEANIDDMNPEFFSYITGKLFDCGALDVTLQPVQMKKNRPGTMISVLTKAEHAEDLAQILFSETTTLGIRRFKADKLMLPRRRQEVETEYGPVRIKIAELNGEIINAAPEYEDCRNLAEKTNTPLKTIYQAAQNAWNQQIK
ncbi:nickel pincer cofactor biosynthesis protein LarC [Dethiobacter alkaliphilus]|uniref:Pyridinium-3,5-bisthiocarboxylic acid mononucleotide nickel insertion protein n=1 Tax=Dethiobacter alkaliphilus AHT 1 TaxID=555088 RepID=C0GGE4_DETAL|nr:nickel pincer cofactor biosynthesis protein LarC [Dethiobacter alkaliphilus]EEG77574.1 protein of unknown function DUF111 [Dethiobacter alkaliphilus AHT 1]